MTVKQQQGRIFTAHQLRWRPLDIAVGAGLGAVSGLIYWLASLLASWIFPLMTALLPGAAALLHGVFYFPCTLSLLILRKPGAAVYVGIISVLVEIGWHPGRMSGRSEYRHPRQTDCIDHMFIDSVFPIQL